MRKTASKTIVDTIADIVYPVPRLTARMANRRTGSPTLRLSVDPFPDRAPEGFKKMAQEVLLQDMLRAEPWQ
jgi:hypothetical protein